MKAPDPEAYGPFYDNYGEETAEFSRYARDLSKYETVRAHARYVIHSLIAAEKEGVREDDFLEELDLEHNTDQQRLARMVRLLLRAMAEVQYDERNAGMVEFANKASFATYKVALPSI